MDKFLDRYQGTTYLGEIKSGKFLRGREESKGEKRGQDQVWEETKDIQRIRNLNRGV